MTRPIMIGMDCLISKWLFFPKHPILNADFIKQPSTDGVVLTYE